LEGRPKGGYEATRAWHHSINLQEFLELWDDDSHTFESFPLVYLLRKLWSEESDLFTSSKTNDFLRKLTCE
jgi:hypothetical protein